MNKQRSFFALGGGNLKVQSTLEIDKIISKKAKARAGSERATGLFFGTASFDSLPYFNSFRKIYTSIFNMKSEIALLTKKELSLENIEQKIEKSHLIYIGGGDPIFMLEEWKKFNIAKMILKAYQNGTVLAGLSAGAICWFENMYTDSKSYYGDTKTQGFHNGLGLIKGCVFPHHEQSNDVLAKQFSLAYGIEDNSALEFSNEELIASYSSGGKAFLFKNGEKQLKE